MADLSLIGKVSCLMTMTAVETGMGGLGGGCGICASLLSSPISTIEEGEDQRGEHTNSHNKCQSC